LHVRRLEALNVKMDIEVNGVILEIRIFFLQGVQDANALFLGQQETRGEEEEDREQTEQNFLQLLISFLA